MSGTVQSAAFRLGLGEKVDAELLRSVPVEVPVAIEYNGFGYAVMMATPESLEDFARGFTLSEGLVEAADRIEAIHPHEIPGGWVIRISLPHEAMTPVLARARTRVSESSCGLCGMDNVAEILRPLPSVGAPRPTNRAAMAKALRDLSGHQDMGRETGAMHAAAFCGPDGTIIEAAEDVGRHNALDKLIGAMARQNIDAASGFVLLSARCSFELVEKTIKLGCPLLVTISAPTSLAVERATQSRLTLLALARRDSALIFNDPFGVFAEGGNHGL